MHACGEPRVEDDLPKMEGVTMFVRKWKV